MTIKVGLVGCGNIAETHVKSYSKLENARITAVCDVIQENAERRAAQAGGAQIFHDLSTLLTESDVQAVDICLPHHLHKDAMIAAARAGKHILCEKPFCITLDEANEVRQTVKEHGVTLMCAHNQLYLPPVQYAKKLLNEGLLGRVYEIRTVDTFYLGWNDLSAFGWRAQRSTSGGGELLDTGYHPSYLLLYLAGSQPVEVTAMLSNFRFDFLEGEDSSQVLVRFASGIVGNIVSSWAYEVGPQTERFQVVGEKGYLSSNGTDLVYRVRGSEPAMINTLTFSDATSFEASFDAQMADFIACLREKRRPIHNEDDGTNVLKLILGAYRSVAEKRMVEL